MRISQLLFTHCVCYVQCFMDKYTCIVNTLQYKFTNVQEIYIAQMYDKMGNGNNYNY